MLIMKIKSLKTLPVLALTGITCLSAITLNYGTSLSCGCEAKEPIIDTDLNTADPDNAGLVTNIVYDIQSLPASGVCNNECEALAPCSWKVWLSTSLTTAQLPSSLGPGPYGVMITREPANPDFTYDYWSPGSSGVDIDFNDNIFTSCGEASNVTYSFTIASLSNPDGVDFKVYTNVVCLNCQ